MTLDDQLFFAANITATTHSSRYIFHKLRGICVFLTQEAMQAVVQTPVISGTDNCNSLVADVPAPSMPACIISSLQLIQNAVAQLVLYLPIFSHTSALHCTLLWQLGAQAHPTSRKWSNPTSVCRCFASWLATLAL